MRISPDKSCERRRIHLDRVGIREPDLHADRLADEQLPLRQHTDATGELGDENFESCSLASIEWPREPLFGAALFFGANFDDEGGAGDTEAFFFARHALQCGH